LPLSRLLAANLALSANRRHGGLRPKNQSKNSFCAGGESKHATQKGEQRKRNESYFGFSLFC
jgi:hypothetical protein